MVRCAVIVMLLGCVMLSCSTEPQHEIAPRTPTVPVEKIKMQQVNAYLHEKEQATIEAYIRRQELQMQPSAEGFYREVVQQGHGTKVTDGSVVTLTGKVMLLDGRLCYQYTSQQPLVFRVKQSTSMTGLHYALNGLSKGTRARFIFPSFMAYGLLGDAQQVPPRSILVCDLEITHVE